MSGQKFIVSAIDTNIGKTLVSAILCEALGAIYWKPIQSGDLEHSDSMKVAELTEGVTILPEAVRLQLAASPHLSAKQEGINILRSQFYLPDSIGSLIIEGAGGVYVPLNEDGLLLADLFQDWQLPVIIVCRHYLGSINHTLLTISALKQRAIPIGGLIYIGEEHKPSESIIFTITGIPTIARIPLVNNPDRNFVKQEAQRLRPTLIKLS